MRSGSRQTKKGKAVATLRLAAATIQEKGIYDATG